MGDGGPGLLARVPVVTGALGVGFTAVGYPRSAGAAVR